MLITLKSLRGKKLSLSLRSFLPIHKKWKFVGERATGFQDEKFKVRTNEELCSARSIIFLREINQCDKNCVPSILSSTAPNPFTDRTEMKGNYSDTFVVKIR